MPIVGAHAVTGACLHFTAARDKLPEMLFAGNTIGGAFGARSRLCARGRSGGRMIAPRGGATARPTAYLIRWDVLRMKPAFLFQKTILTIVQVCAIIDDDGTCENIVPTKERPQKRYAEDDQKGLVSSKTSRS